MMKINKSFKIIGSLIMVLVMTKVGFTQCTEPSSPCGDISTDNIPSTEEGMSLGNVVDIDNIVSNMPRRNSTIPEYNPPNECDMFYWCQLLEELLRNNDLPEAARYAHTLSYELTTIDEENDGIDDYYWLQKTTTGNNYWGTYIFNASSDRANLIFQSPHPLNDGNRRCIDCRNCITCSDCTTGCEEIYGCPDCEDCDCLDYDETHYRKTGSEGLFLFETLGARAFMMAGTHRCNSPDFSDCDGTTRVCNRSGEDYRISDLAHTDTSIFHVTTVFLDDLINRGCPYSCNTEPVFVQLHGFNPNTRSGRTHIQYMISSGTRSPHPNIQAIENYLTSQSLNVCVYTGTGDCNFLGARTNTQGRYLNGSVDNPCNDTASISSGKFIHIEQSNRDDVNDASNEAVIGDTNNWSHLATAIGNVVPLNSLSPSGTSSTINVVANPVPLGIYQACEFLTSASHITSADTVIFRAGSRIRLQEGFRATAGTNSRFRAHICDNP